MSAATKPPGSPWHRGVMKRLLPLLTVALTLTGCRPVVEGSAPQGDPSPAYAELLARVVTANGLVDYELLRQDDAPLRAYVGWLGLDPGPLSEAEAFARGINAYNAFVLLGVLEHWPLKSIKDVKIGILPSFGAGFFVAQRFRLNGQLVNLKGFEDTQLREAHRDARVHGAINCASIGCPPLSAELFEAERLDAQLTAAMTRMVAQRVRVEPGPDGKVEVVFNELFSWFQDDFLSWNGSASLCHYVADFDASYKPLAEAGCPHRFESYDWSLNASP